ncbi:hypothetical protein CMUS01_02948 [Colletotrichum musicola]|uniref:Uncharacterized protein n=1 Tax=Colletotrichum musicola TaxID=2175873 RepID=A0A8H6NU31_9PEZI|nr:hypothetical protein CMUS01_02948 [Colletotrichum musicola]
MVPGVAASPVYAGKRIGKGSSAEGHQFEDKAIISWASRKLVRDNVQPGWTRNEHNGHDRPEYCPAVGTKKKTCEGSVADPSEGRHRQARDSGEANHSSLKAMTAPRVRSHSRKSFVSWLTTGFQVPARWQKLMGSQHHETLATKVTSSVPLFAHLDAFPPPIPHRPVALQSG